MDVNNLLADIPPILFDWMIQHGFKMIGVVVVTYILQKFGVVFIEKFVRRAVVANDMLSKDAEKKREDTLIRIFSGTFRVVIWIMVVIMLLSEAGIDTGPLIAGAGVAGLAVGFGGQYLIRDIIAGMFIIIENQYRVNDVVCLDSTCGLVEDITLRMTILRDLDGTVHHVPNGLIGRASNLSKNFSRVNLNIGISYSSDLEKVIKVVNKIGRDLSEDKDWKSFILKPPQFLRVDNFGDSAIEIKILGDTLPLKQWDVTGELRKRIKIAFDKEGIEIPFPQRVIHQIK